MLCLFHKWYVLPISLHDNMLDDENSLRNLERVSSHGSWATWISAYDKCRELTIEDNQVKPGNGDRENEYQHQYNADPSSWQISMHMNRGLENWTREFVNERVHHGPVNDHNSESKSMYAVKCIQYEISSCFAFQMTLNELRMFKAVGQRIQLQEQPSSMQRVVLLD
uniref:Uncharacterized protein n=1 Tax=Tanacetum cinerariifolium TaxID=118510 RepID=A0A6L2M4I3_TANCI|nr:hypothetical protein [Tanacetum cinerariifolium]